ncbi:MAG: 3-phosphoserine/phosphohydroxythreonine transaminase [Calditrichaeota bacterium]|jgi:phosphoserine aminotransferase|nr:3-phosphoserine/phosphohydroxythreonine transaminase [Calditrichota bacterium]MBT7788942.1 3-phosphoserine/phosphohydroxythreonine transaminase [Calditrichota bacterium]
MKHDRIWNFNAGPAALPLEVLEKVHEQWFNFQGSGMCEIEMSHRSKEFDAIHNNTIAMMKKLLGLGDNYHVLFVQGGASQQFGMLPMGFLDKNKTADYINTGTWSTKAIKEAQLFGNVNVAFDGNEVDFMRLPKQEELKLSANAEYLHFTSNNTIKGTQFFDFPKTENGIPLVCDMSSDILSHRFDPAPFGMMYAGAQKNLGPSGVTLVILRDDFYQKASTNVTSMLKYKTHVDKNSLYNTPNTFGIYLMGLVLNWIDGLGGLEGVEKINKAKADLLYGTMSESNGYYRCPVAEDSRSWMNVCFRLPSEELEGMFVAQGLEAGFCGMKGHRSVGGCRISMYNASPLQAIEDVTAFMKDFMAKNG